MGERILVCGGRTWGYTPESDFQEKDWEVFNQSIDYLKTLGPSFIVSGGAKGADELGPLLAQTLDLPHVVYRPDWHTHGKAAGPIRNKRMLDEGKPTLVVAFPGGRGTQNMVDLARKSKVRVLEV